MAKYVCNVCGIEFFTAIDCCKHKKLVHDLNFSQCNRCGDFLPQEDVVCFESYSFCHDCVQLLPGQKTSDTSSCISETELDCNRLVDECETLLDCREKIFPPKQQEEKNSCFDFSNCNSSNFFDCPPMTDNSETDFNCLKLKKAKKLLTVKNCFYCDECQQEFLDAFRYYSHDCDQVSNSEQISQSSKSLNDLTVATKRFSNSKSRYNHNGEAIVYVTYLAYL